MTRWWPAAHAQPVGQLVGEQVAIVEEAAFLADQPARVGSGPSGHPTERSFAGQLREAFDRQPDVLTLRLFGDRAIVDPAIAVADDLVPAAHAGLGQLGVQLQRAHDTQYAHGDSVLGEDVEQAPGAAPAAVFEHQLHQRHAAAVSGDADVVEHALRHRIAVGERGLAAALDVEVEVDGDMRAAGPSRVRRELAVADEVAGNHRIGLGLRDGRLAHVSPILVSPPA